MHIHTETYTDTHRHLFKNVLLLVSFSLTMHCDIFPCEDIYIYSLLFDDSVYYIIKMCHIYLASPLFKLFQGYLDFGFFFFIFALLNNAVMNILVHMSLKTCVITLVR